MLNTQGICDEQNHEALVSIMRRILKNANSVKSGPLNHTYKSYDKSTTSLTKKFMFPFKV